MSLGATRPSRQLSKRLRNRLHKIEIESNALFANFSAAQFFGEYRSFGPLPLCDHRFSDPAWVRARECYTRQC
jgi:hypothetical protein